MSATKKNDIFVALDDYASQHKGELSFSKGDNFKILKNAAPDDGWWNAQNLNTKKKGWIPCSLVALDGSLELFDWCHGAISRNGADYLLKQHGIDGMYLVRESQSQPGQYTLDVWKEGKSVHYRITKGDEGYFFRQGVCFPTIPELIQHHQTRSDGLCSSLDHIAPKAHAKTIVIGMDMEKKWELKRSEVILGDRLGGGNYGEVFKGIYNNKTVAIKTIKEESMETVEFMKEAHVMKKLQHPNLVKLIGVCSTELPMYIVQEFVPYGDLLSYLRLPQSRIQLDHVSMLYIAQQIADGMSALEAQNTIHRDLAARNCLVGENLSVKVADFGMGRVVDDLYTARTGTKMPIKWTAPEALCYDAFSVKSDVWSFGITLWEIATFGDVPYPGLEARDVINQLEGGYRMPEPQDCPAGLYEIMTQCWALESRERPSFFDLQHQLDDLHKNTKGEASGSKLERTKSQMGTSWRKGFEGDKSVDKDLIAQLIDLTREIFSVSQQLFRYGTDDTYGEMVESVSASVKALLQVAKNVKALDKVTLKKLSVSAAALAKAKTSEKAKPCAESIRDLARELNKASRLL
ncbi:uncharacterized protein MONBRDRAFT_44237 [Monosiga brevicollis MX1]|uniref:non-specific protein-tyrosine kinase n=1 Tax=Monosiga brevicollis TaxID=81824 RepID=A9V014_MONBE|nr:uncharacterized protein MONBRDRAFT_44237 [Monosiga brevicollis MX1]EDQ88932.1 predicted protein [Monosiga brevicollis MX1]|eukprot:XP_001746037.1 hypothetical protein [Monosiga brevicollis MX1]